MSNTGWIGVDLDGTLAHYDGWKGPDHIGEPVPKMLTRVRNWLREGKDVRIFTARAYAPQPRWTAINGPEEIDPEWIKATLEHYRVLRLIGDWCEKHLGKVLPITCTKDYSMIQLWDDRAVQVIPNTGIRVDSLVPKETL